MESPTPYIPTNAAHLWDWFWTLSSQRTESHPLRFGDIDSASRLLGWNVRQPEIEVLLSMDIAYRDELRIEQSAMEARQKWEAEQRGGKGRRG